jgi:hypothetical protein
MTTGLPRHVQVRLRNAALLIAALGILALPGLATAQQPGDPGAERESPFQPFQDHQVERIRPDSLPDIGPLLPSRSTRHSLDDLPRVMSSADLQRIAETIEATTVPIIAVHRPPQPFRQTEMIYHGYALWISAVDDGEDEPPLLIATADWLVGAEAVYAVVGDEARRGIAADHLDSTSRRPMDIRDVTAGTDYIERHRDQLVALEIRDLDPFVNLSWLVPDDDTTRASLDVPERGFLVHDMGQAMPGSLFGLGSTLSSVMPLAYQDSQELPAEYSYYFLTTSTATRGAPIVSPTGRLLGIAAILYPPDPHFSLAIPPGAVHHYLEKIRGLDE